LSTSHDTEQDGIQIEDGTQGNLILTEEEIGEFIRSEQEAAAQGNNADIDSKYTPQIGMEFKSRDEANHFFSFYGFLAGFEVVVAHVTRTAAKNRNKEIYKQEMKCHRYGKQEKKVKEYQTEETLLVEGNNEDKTKRRTNVQVKTDRRCVMCDGSEGNLWNLEGC